MRFIPTVTVFVAALFLTTSASAQQAYRDYISEQERTYGQARNAVVIIARAAFADKLQEKAFYACMRQDGWTFVNN